MAIESDEKQQEDVETTSAYKSQAPDFGAAADQDPLIGQVVAGRYRVLKQMGEGGMGTVYLAEHVTIEKKIALKVLLHEYARKEDLKKRFVNEAKAAASIGHENIIDITDFGDTPNHSVFFAMEYLDGRDLSAALKDDGPFPWARAKPVLLQICRALGAAHAKDVIHRDMKPENIFLIEREGRPDFVKVLDFGIAKVSGLAEGENRLTRTGMIFGTPEYMSPEQAQGHLPDHRVDIYAVGVIMYELLTGEVPFKADTFMGILTKHIFEQPVPPTELKPELGIPFDAEQIILKAMAKDREERFTSMTEMATAIQQTSGRMTRPSGDYSPARHVTAAPRIDRASFSRVTGKPGTGQGKVAEPVAVPPMAVPTNRNKIIAILGGIAAVAAIGVAAAFAIGSGGGDDEGKRAGSAAAGAGSALAAAGSGSGAAGAAAPAAPGTGAGEASGKKKPVALVPLKITTKPSGAIVYRGEIRLGDKTPVPTFVPPSVLLTFTHPRCPKQSKAYDRAKHGGRLHVVLEGCRRPKRPAKKPVPVAKTEPTKTEPTKKRQPTKRQPTKKRDPNVRKSDLMRPKDW